MKKKITILIIALALLIAAGFFLFKEKNIFKPAPKQIYEVAVIVRGQQVSDPVEDLRSSLKVGDVLTVQEDGHLWSSGERISYLILKMELTEEQKNKLTASKERIRDKSELSEEERQMVEEEEKNLKEAGERQAPEQLKETVIAREYYIDMNEFPGFKADDLLSGQPEFAREVYGWGIVEKKK